jgi:NAD(P)-dependent dehydrogenase (short-subunit alcohol dehydrogenase family)
LTGRVAGRRILVSGGTSGIGAATSRRLSDEGASVWILGSRNESLQAALEQLDIAGGSVCDVSSEGAVEQATAEAIATLGGLDGAFVNAGIDGEDRGVLELSVEHFRRVLEVNVLGAFLVARAAARTITPGGTIVVNASVNGVRPEAGFADYNASKAAAISLAQTMALELADRRIAVIAICPGYVRTKMTEPYLDKPDTAAELLAQIPSARFGEPAEVAGLVAFLLSDEATYMTGGVVTIDGARSV